MFNNPLGSSYHSILGEDRKIKRKEESSPRVWLKGELESNTPHLSKNSKDYKVCALVPFQILFLPLVAQEIIRSWRMFYPYFISYVNPRWLFNYYLVLDAMKFYLIYIYIYIYIYKYVWFGDFKSLICYFGCRIKKDCNLVDLGWNSYLDWSNQQTDWLNFKF